MNKKWIGLLLQYGITALVGSLAVWGLLSLRGYAQAQTAAEQYRILADAFTVPGLFMMLTGALIWVANLGTFDSIGYSLSYAVRRLFFLGGGTKPEKFYDYKERKKEKRKQRAGYGFLIITGGVFMAAAIVFIILFYQVY